MNIHIHNFDAQVYSTDVDFPLTLTYVNVINLVLVKDYCGNPPQALGFE